MNRPSDCPHHRLAVLVRARAERNQRDQDEAAAVARELYAEGHSVLSLEQIITEAAGAYVRLDTRAILA